MLLEMLVPAAVIDRTPNLHKSHKLAERRRGEGVIEDAGVPVGHL